MIRTFGETAKGYKIWHVFAPDHPLPSCVGSAAWQQQPQLRKRLPGSLPCDPPQWPQGGRVVPWEGDQLSQEGTPNWLHSLWTWGLKQIILSLKVFIQKTAEAGVSGEGRASQDKVKFTNNVCKASSTVYVCSFCLLKLYFAFSLTRYRNPTSPPLTRPFYLRQVTLPFWTLVFTSVKIVTPSL